ncbi:MAG: hypothetical protein M5U23_10795 [Acidimicrobiia bacterium]|nr:hypothetical protein [Acidimicrobiia bacterium]
MTGQTYRPDDEDAFFAARDELVSRFEGSRGGRDLGWVASQVMDFKWGYLDGDLSRWETADIEEILLGLYPAKVVLDPEDLDQVVTGFAGFLRFLGDDGIVTHSHALRMAESVERLAAQFEAAAMDENNWSMGKRLWSFAQSEGVDPSDPHAVQEFLDDFNQRSFAERDAVLGPSPVPDVASLGDAFVGALPPIVLPPIDELESTARNTVAYTQLQRLVDYVGDGKPLTDRGNLKLVDGKALVDLLETADRFDEKIGDRVFKTRSSADLAGVDLIFQMALEAKILTRKGKKLLPGPNADLIDDPLAALYAAWLVLLHTIGPTQHRYRNERYGWDWFAEELDASLPFVLVDLYRHGDIPIDEIIEDAWGNMLDVFDLKDLTADRLKFHQGLVDMSLRRALDVLGDLGSVRVEDVTEKPTRYGGTDRTGGVAGLTPLGKWAVQRWISRVVSAPIVGALRESTASELLAAVSNISEAEAVAEIDTWVDHQGPGAALQLVEAMRTADETERGLGFRALLRIGPDAEHAVNRLSDDVEFAPYATVWRIDTCIGSLDDIDCRGDVERFVRLLDVVIELWGPAAALGTWVGPAAGTDGVSSMVEQAWRVKLPQTEQVLATIASGHPDKSTAKAARKALFKYRTAV